MTPRGLARGGVDKSAVEQIRARADAATEVLTAKRGADAIEIIGVDGRSIATCWTWDEAAPGDANADFIAAARADVPWLLDRLAEVQADRDSLRNILAADEMLKRQRELRAERDALRARVEAVREMHRPRFFNRWHRRTDDRDDAVAARCDVCCQTVPLDGCETFRAALSPAEEQRP